MFIRTKPYFGLVCFVYSLLFASSSIATTIEFSVQNLGGESWQYNYVITNDSLGADIEEFTIFFEEGSFENLTITASADGWDAIVIDPDPNLPDDGFFDACNSDTFCFGNGIAIAPTESLGGFSVSFDFLGDGTPGSQAFDIVDPETFDVLGSGATVAAIPLPAAAWLLLSALAGLFSFRRSDR